MERAGRLSRSDRDRHDARGRSAEVYECGQSLHIINDSLPLGWPFRRAERLVQLVKVRSTHVTTPWGRSGLQGARGGLREVDSLATPASLSTTSNECLSVAGYQAT